MVVERFTAWLESAKPEQKFQAIADVVATFEKSEKTSEEQAACERLFGYFLTDPNPVVRQQLADELSKMNNAPKALLWHLLQDEPAIAASLYSQSDQLCERTLIAGIEEGGTCIQVAIAGRSGLSGQMVRSLIAHGAADAIARLLQNDEIVLGPVLKHDIAQAHGNDAQIRDLLLSEDDLAPATRQMLLRGLSGALVDFVCDMNWTDKKRLKTIATDSTNRVTLDIAAQSNITEMATYVGHLRATAQLTPALILRSICAGHAAFFEAALANLSDMTMKRIQSIIDDARPSVFRALYAKTKLPAKAFNVFCSAIAVWQHLETEFADTSFTEAELYVTALGQIVELAEKDETTDASLMAMLHRMLAEATRDQLNSEHHLKLLTAA